MKLTTKILTAMLLLFVVGLFASNIILKKELDKADKSDLYWNFGKISDEPFKHIKIDGGNLTHIVFEENKTPSVKVNKNWEGYLKNSVKTMVKNDTLFLTFPNTYRDIYEKRWMKWEKLVRVFAPELLSVTGTNTNFEMMKTHQKSINVHLSGKSGFEMESMLPELDTLNITQSDSSEVVFEMSPDYKKSESFHVKYVNATVKGYSLLDLGHGQIDSLQLSIDKNSAVALSGGALKNKRGN
jgi:hypothetical protein